MPLYDTIKAQEANFPLPQPTATIEVGTFDAANGKFTYSVPEYKVTDPVELDDRGKPIKRQTHIGGEVTAINVFDLKLRFKVVHRVGDFSAAPDNQAAVEAAPGNDFVDIDAGTATSLSFSLACHGKEFDSDLPLKIERHIAAAGAITIPALPVSIIYAPPVDQQKKNVATWTSTDITGNTTSMAFSSQASTTVPAPSQFQSVVDLAAAMKAISPALSAIPNAYAQAAGTALSVISGVLGSSTATGTSSTKVLDKKTLTITLSSSASVSTIPTGGGPGNSDVICFLKNARVVWYTDGGPLKLALIGWDSDSYVSAALLQQDSGPTGLDKATRDALLKLDPFVAGGPSVLPPSSRFVYNNTLDINGSNATFNLTHSVTNTDLSQTETTDTKVADGTASFAFLASLNIGVTDTRKVQVILTSTSAAQTSTTKTVSRQAQFNAGPNEYYSVEVYCDVIFGTFAFRPIGSSAAPPVTGQALNKQGKPLVSTEVSLTSGGRTFKTITDANGQFTFRANTIKPGPMRISSLNAHQDIGFTGSPVHNLKLTDPQS